MMAPILKQQAGWPADELLQDLLPDISGLSGLRITGLSMDSRKVQSGDLFFACAGYQQHGLIYLQQAESAGAVLVLAEISSQWPASRIHELAVESRIKIVIVAGLSASISSIAGRFYAQPAVDMRMLGITGTNGKTSVSQYIAQALPASWHCAVVGTTGNGFPGDLQTASHTTPDAVDAQALLADLKQLGARAVAMEVSSHALDQHRVAAVPFHTVVFTNLSRDHLDYHHSMQAYAEAKASLFRRSGLSLAVINTDDSLGQKLALELRGNTRVIACGRRSDTASRSDEYIQLLDTVTGVQGLNFSIRSPWGDAQIHSQLIGDFNADNLLLVLGVLLGWDNELQQSVARLEQLQPVAGRMQCLGGKQQPLVVIDYAHTPDALEKALQALRSHTTGRLICVFGCGGDRDQGKRPLMGAVAEGLADQLIITNDNPRHEPAARIIGQIVAGMQNGNAVQVIPARAQAIKVAIQGAAKGDVVLIAGKGHEDYQQVGDLKHRFSDLEQVQDALQGWKYA